VTRNLEAEDRWPAIAEAVIAVFARHGFAGATTKKRAEPAGISEALLYKYFSSKGDNRLRGNERRAGPPGSGVCFAWSGDERLGSLRRKYTAKTLALIAER
jgi:AcrR family transcriptional regulator